MSKKTQRRMLNDKRKYMGVWIDKDTYDALMSRAYKGGETLSQFVREVLDNAAKENFI